MQIFKQYLSSVLDPISADSWSFSVTGNSTTDTVNNWLAANQ